MKKIIAFLLIFLLALTAGCSRKENRIPTEDVELWVVTEKTEQYRMNDQATRMIEAFEEMHPNVTVKLDILPTDETEREVTLKRLRTQIMSGDGPDAYLLPTQYSVWVSSGSDGEWRDVEPIFRDVKIAMYNGLFYDISKYYDTDETLMPEELNTSVMDGGVLDGARYVLPLRYDMGVYLVAPENLQSWGLDAALFQENAAVVNQRILELGDTEMAFYCVIDSEFGAYLDYDTGSVRITEEEIATYLRQLQHVLCMEMTDYEAYGANITTYIDGIGFFASSGYPLLPTSLSGLPGILTVAGIQGEELEIYPKPDVHGELSATVEYYAAVGAGCEYPRLAYEFLRMFLSEEAQHETYMATDDYKRADAHAWSGWPVRTAGSVEPQLNNILFRFRQNAYEGKMRHRQEKVLKQEGTLTDEDIPAINWQADTVVFPVYGEGSLDHYMDDDQLAVWDFYTGYTALENVDFEAIAKEAVTNMQAHLDEG